MPIKMKSLITFIYRNSNKLGSCKYITPTFQFKFNSTKSGDGQFPPINELDEIKTIEENETKYFATVKKSFDALKNTRVHESLEEKRSRLMYQSRKRGISENGILLSNFSADFLPKMTEKEMNEYDCIINDLHNEWDLYYWLTDAMPIPDSLKTNTILMSMKKYCMNEDSKGRYIQPDLTLIK